MLLWSNIAKIYTTHWLISFLISFIISASFYRFIYKMILIICKKIIFLKRWALGGFYFEGLWIGYYTVDGQKIYYYEIFKQDMEELKIIGESFDASNAPCETWTILHPNILIDESKMTYYYELNDSASADIILGYSSGTIYFDDNHFPNRLVGFAVDSYSSEKQPYVSKKIDLKNYQGSQADWINSHFFVEVHKLSDNII